MTAPSVRKTERVIPRKVGYNVEEIIERLLNSITRLGRFGKQGINVCVSFKMQLFTGAEN